MRRKITAIIVTDFACFFIEIFQISQLHTSLHNELVKYNIVLEARIKVEIVSNKMYVIK